MGNEDAIIVKTGLSDDRAQDILNSVIGQMSDGIWENSSRMNRYWQYADIIKEGSELAIKISYPNSYENGFRGKSETEIKKFFAQKVKQIVKEEGLNWDRNNEERSCYLDYHSGATVKDAYRVYDKLLGRRERITEANQNEDYAVIDDASGSVLKKFKTIEDAKSAINNEVPQKYRYMYNVIDMNKVTDKDNITDIPEQYVDKLYVEESKKLNEDKNTPISDKYALIKVKVDEALSERGINIRLMHETCSEFGIAKQMREVIHNIFSGMELSVYEYVYGEDFDFTLDDKLNFSINMLEDLDEDKEINKPSITITPAERKILDAIKTVNSKYDLSNIKLETTPDGATHIMSTKGEDIVTIKPLSDDEKEDLRLNGYYINN